MPVVEKKPWYASKTMWVGVIETALGLAEVLSESAIVGDAITGYALIAVGILTMALRVVTDHPVGVRRGVAYVDE